MAIVAARNFHVPLPEALYDALRREAERAREPATVLARRAIEAWLAERQRAAVHEAVAAYAARHAGTELDLDPALEQAAIEALRTARPDRRRRR
jgi:hypothetical protein